MVYAVAAERDTDTVLRRVLAASRELTGARYAAVGVLDGADGFATFLTSGISGEQWDAIGELPRQHGLLATLLADPAPVRLPDVRRDPRFSGWPKAHPVMTSFLGVPVVAGGEILAELYLADKADGEPSTDADQQVTETLAAHAALPVANAQRLDRSRELSVATERARMARDLHDSVPAATAGAVNRAHDEGRRVVAVGTTVVRALESAVRDDRVVPLEGWTELKITLDRRVSTVDGLLTGWHEPATTHLLMLEAIAGRERLCDSYRVALSEGYRWREFGDLNLLLPRRQERISPSRSLARTEMSAVTSLSAAAPVDSRLVGRWDRS